MEKLFTNLFGSNYTIMARSDTFFGQFSSMRDNRLFIGIEVRVHNNQLMQDLKDALTNFRYVSNTPSCPFVGLVLEARKVTMIEPS